MGKELDNVKAEKITIKIGGKEREIRFGFSAWAVLEREYGTIQNLQKAMEQDITEHPLEKIPHLLYIGIVDKEGLKADGYIEENLLDDYGFGDMEYISGIFGRALWGSIPQTDEKKAEMEA